MKNPRPEPPRCFGSREGRQAAADFDTPCASNSSRRQPGTRGNSANATPMLSVRLNPNEPMHTLSAELPGVECCICPIATAPASPIAYVHLPPSEKQRDQPVGWFRRIFEPTGTRGQVHVSRKTVRSSARHESRMPDPLATPHLDCVRRTPPRSLGLQNPRRCDGVTTRCKPRKMRIEFNSRTCEIRRGR